MKSFINRLKVKIRVCFNILFIWKHWAILSIDSEGVYALVGDEEKEINLKIAYHRLHPYVLNKLLIDITDNISDVDMICQKAEFQSAALNS